MNFDVDVDHGSRILGDHHGPGRNDLIWKKEEGDGFSGSFISSVPA